LFEGSTGAGDGPGVGPGTGIGAGAGSGVVFSSGGIITHEAVELWAMQLDCKTAALDKATTFNTENFIKLIFIITGFC
jgi:hypothetical protein